jgi:UDP-N-acetylmuramoylalanine--D-glutamate ligase
MRLRDADMQRIAVFGLARAGTATARALAGRGFEVVLADDVSHSSHQQLATELGCQLVDVSTPLGLRNFLEGVDTLIPAPGVPPRHALIQRAQQQNITVRTEIDVAYEWEQARAGGPRPILGVTGTDGKTTTTMIAAHLLRATGRNVAEVGNTDVPFMEALDGAHDAFVVECSSFRLQFTEAFRCDGSVWLNLAHDHLDWHETFDAYTEAKKRLWAHARSSDVAVVPCDNEVIMNAAVDSGARVVTFGLEEGDYRRDGNALVSPRGRLADVSTLWRALPHDITNSLAAAALVIESGLTLDNQVGAPLQTFTSAHHRIELVGKFDGSEWFDDSKATSPHAALTAIRGFDRLVLIAGGRNKDLDLSQMASEPQRMHAVVAIGDDAALIEDAFRNVCPVVKANTMEEAVKSARALALPGVSVVLSPGCTSYDWYTNYNERGDHFQACVRQEFSSPERSSS